MKVYAYNPTTESAEKSFLTQAYNAGADTINVKNNDRFALNQRIMIGEMGRERTEIVTVDSAPTGGNAVPVSTTVFDHDETDPVYILDYDQVRFYRSTDGEDGTYSQIGSNVALDVDNANLQTVYDDTTGTSAYFYKVDFYHSVSTEASDKSEPISGTGYTRFQIGRVIEEVAREVGDPNFEFISPEEYVGIANECSDDLQSRTKKPYSFLLTEENLSTTAGQNYIDVTATTDKLWKHSKTRYNYTNADGTDRTDPYRYLSYDEFVNRFVDNTIEDSDQLQYLTYDEATDRVLLYPTPATSQSNVVKFRFWKYFSEFTNLSDLVETPNARVYKLFMKGHYYKQKAIQDRAFLAISDRIDNQYESEVARLHRYRKDHSEPKQFQPSFDNKGLRRY